VGSSAISPLWYLTPVAWDVYEAADRSLRVFYSVTGTSGGPSFRLERVEVRESSCEVVVNLYQRVTSAASKLAAVYDCIELELAAPLGTRAIHNGAIDAPVIPLNRAASPEDPDGGRMFFHARSAQQGCHCWDKPCVFPPTAH
jgi:hypothetical protein